MSQARARAGSFFVWLCAFGAAGCPSADDTARVTCDPLAAQMEPVALGSVIAAGKAADGTLYVAARDPDDRGQDRIFVSSGDALVRHRVVGSGAGGDRDFTWAFAEDDGSSRRRLVAKLSDDGTVDGIALAPSENQRSFFDQLGSDATPLTPVAANALSGLAVRNLPGDVHIEYVAEVEGGAQLIVTRPEDDWSYDDFRVFYSTSGPLLERTVKSVQRSSYTVIELVVNGADFKATFGSSLSPIASELDTGTAVLALKVLPPSAADNTAFRCFP